MTAPSPEDSEDIECFTDVSTCNSFAGLPDIFDHDDEAHVPDFPSTERVEGRIETAPGDEALVVGNCL